MNDQQDSHSEFSHDQNVGLKLPPWEERERFGVLNALYLTIKDVLLAPGHFFHRMPTRSGLVQPLLFAIIVGFASTFISWMYSLVSSSLQIALFGNFPEGNSTLIAFFIFLFSPVLVALGVFVQAAFIHLFLVVLGGGRLGFEGTFRVTAYAEASALLILIPLCGSWLALVWGLVILIIGLYNVHETQPWKAVLAVLAPMFLCFAVVGGSVALWLSKLSF